MRRNVLVFHAGALGDLVLALPVALALTRLYPASRVRFIASGQKAALAARLTGVEPLDVESLGFSALFSPDAPVQEAVRKLLDGAHRILSFVAEPTDVWSARVGALAPEARLTWLRLRPPPGWLDPASGSAHAGDHLLQQCALPERGGDVTLAEAARQIRQHITRTGLLRPLPAQGRGILLHPGAGSPAKCWPLDSFRELALLLRDALGETVSWALGEVELERMGTAQRRAMEAVGDVHVTADLPGLLDEITAARIFIGNDSGPGHLAAVAGVPVVSLFGPTDPDVWRPLGPQVAVVRAPGGDLARLSAQDVLGAARGLIIR